MATQYGVAYYDGSKVVTTEAGTLGQFFVSNGYAPPSFQTISGAGTLVLLQTQIAGGATSITFASNFSSTYATYVLTWSGLTGTASASLLAQVSTDNGSTWTSSGYTSGSWAYSYNSTSQSNATSTDHFILSAVDSSIPSSGSAALSGMGFSSYPTILVDVLCIYEASILWLMTSGQQSTIGTYNAIQVTLLDSGVPQAITGTFSLYGVVT